MSGTLDGISAALDEVFREIREKVREAGKEAKIWESLQAFAAAVDWTLCANFCYHSDCHSHEYTCACMIWVLTSRLGLPAVMCGKELILE